jgi:cyclin T
MQEVYEQQKELILLGERVVLATLGFDLNVHHPYKPLVEAIKKFKVAQNALAQVAWNFVNDGYASFPVFRALIKSFQWFLLFLFFTL